MTRLHIMGIGGSAMSAVAILAHQNGFSVTGCDLSEDTPYIEKVKKLGIETFVGHDAHHLEGVDIVAVTPAAFFQNDQHPEFQNAKTKDILLTGKEFEAKFLHKNKNVICIAGTHGKSTTTGMAALVFEQAKLDPSVIIGATVKEWASNCRAGKSDLFITESDEFFDSFLNYSPDTIILNNIEFDHPDYFKNEKQLFESFRKHVQSLKGAKNLIINQDSTGIKKLLNLLEHEVLDSINLYGYTLKDSPEIELVNSTKATDIIVRNNMTHFRVGEEDYALVILGEYNISNALGVIILAKLYAIPPTIVQTVLGQFSGVGRRLELLGSSNDIAVYDDYAHHPTAIKVTLQGLKQRFPQKRILAVVEPHTYSRTKALLQEYNGAFDAADKVIIAPIFKSRDKETFGISEEDIVKVANHSSISFVDSFEKAHALVKSEAKKGDIVVVMGAGDSYKLSRDILHSL